MAGKKTPGSGRKKGVPNKLTADVRQALTIAFDELGGVPALVRWGKKSREPFYKLWAKLLPKELNLRGSVPLALAITEQLAESLPHVDHHQNGHAPQGATRLPPV